MIAQLFTAQPSKSVRWWVVEYTQPGLTVIDR